MAQSILLDIDRLWRQWFSLPGIGAVIDSMAVQLKNEQEFGIEFAELAGCENTRVNEQVFRGIAKGYLAHRLQNTNKAWYIDYTDYRLEDINELNEPLIFDHKTLW